MSMAAYAILTCGLDRERCGMEVLSIDGFEEGGTLSRYGQCKAGSSVAVCLELLAVKGYNISGCNVVTDRIVYTMIKMHN